MSFPLRWKLVSLYATILILVLGGFGAAVLIRLRQVWDGAADAECRARAAALAAVLDQDAGKWVIEPESGIEREFAADRGLYFAVLRPGGELLLASPLARELGRTAIEQGSTRGFRAKGTRWREVNLPVTLPADPEEGRPEETLEVLCGRDMRDAEFSLGSLVGQLLIVGPLSLLLGLAAGYWLVSRALFPIDRMAQTAEAISATDLSRRIDVRGHDEVARLGRTLNATFGRLQEAFDQERRFTADASHELRTPLAIIAGSAELALGRPRNAEELREMVADIRDATLRMQATVQGLLTLARADAGRLVLAREAVSLRRIAEEVLALHRPLAGERGVALDLQPGTDVLVLGDAERLKELLSNLVINGIHHTDRNGQVSVTVGSGQDFAELAVSDTGVGIAPEHLPHIFERFYRADDARTRARGGSGLGLAIAKWIAEAHEGRIDVTSSQGSGTRFVVKLPPAPAVAREPA